MTRAGMGYVLGPAAHSLPPASSHTQSIHAYITTQQCITLQYSLTYGEQKNVVYQQRPLGCINTLSMTLGVNTTPS